jgi:TonB family protein
MWNTLPLLAALAAAPALAQAPSPYLEESGPTLPVVVSAPPPVYPAEALVDGVQSSVLLQIAVGEAGEVLAVEVVESGGPGFDEAAIQAARDLVLEPARDAAGEPVGALIQYRYRFQAEAAALPSLEVAVLDPETEVPVIGAPIRLTGPNGEARTALSDEDGKAQLAGLADGTWQIAVQPEGRVAELLSVEITAGKVVTATVRPAVQATPEELADLVITVIGDRATTEVTERILTTEEIRYLPGTGGDVVRVVQNLPGVARPPLGIGQLIIRGTSPEDSRFFLDGGPIPIVFHFAGLTTVVNGDSLRDVAFLPGGYGVRYGRTLGGLVDLRVDPELPDEATRYVAVDVYQTTAFIEQPLSERTLSGRRSYIDAVLNPILNNGNAQVQAPRYYDLQARLLHVAPGGASFDAFFALSDDRFRVLGPEDEGSDPIIGLTTSFQKLRLLYRKPLANGWEASLTATGGPTARTFEFGGGTAEAYEKPVLVNLRPELMRGTEDGGYGYRIGLDVDAGVDRYKYDIGGFGIPEQGSTPVFAPGAYAEASVPAGPFRFVPGVRADALMFEDGTIGPWIDPRFGATLTASESTLFKLSAGRYGQPPLTRELLGEGDGNPALYEEWAIQLQAGVEQDIGPVVKTELTGFYTDLHDLVVGRDTAFEFFSGPPPIGPFDEGAYANAGTGRIYGVEGLMRFTTDRTLGLLAVTYSRSYRTDRYGNESLFDYDQPLIINALVSQKLGKGWRLGGRVRNSSGNPYTPVVNKIYDLGSRSFVPVYGAVDSDRLPSFFALDLRVDKEWEFKKWSLTFYLDLQNATNATNPEVMSWTYDYSEEDPISALPTIPAFGLRGDF